MNELNLESEYSKLLKFLESQNSTPKSRNVKVEKQSFESFKDIPTVKSYKKKGNSKGFDISKFESLMINKIKESQEKLQNYERPYLSITEIIGCLRKSYFFRLKYKETNSYIYPYLDLINHVGKEIHKYVLDIYGYDEVEKSIISEKYKVKGRFDAILNKNVLIELKTDDTQKFYKRKTYVNHHYYQSVIYSYLLNTEYGYNIQDITLVYFLRNLKDIIPFDLKVDNELAKSFLNNALLLKNCIDKKELIDTINSSEEECSFCPYKELCKKSSRDKKENRHAFLL